MATRYEKVTRRDFLAKSGTLGAGAVLMSALGGASAADAAAVLPKVKLGRTGESVTTLGIGSTYPITPPLLNTALAEGVTYIDTAQGYLNGNSEKDIGAILEKAGRRKDCFLVTKSGDHETGKFASLIDMSLERLRTDHVDLYFLHDLGNPDRLDQELKAAVERLKKSKKVRFFGFSSHNDRQVEVMERAAEVGFVDVIMLKYSFRDYDNAALNRALDKCTKAGIGLVAMKTQGGAVPQERVAPFGAKGFNQYQATLKAVWEDKRIHSIVSAMKNVQQVKENAAAAREGKMGALEREQLEQYAQATSSRYCRGCSRHCESRVEGPLQIAETLRYRMYYENYGEVEEARRLFRALPPASRRFEGVDFAAAEAACPYGLPVGKMVRDAAALLA
jgi:predicted aldo/keto reductase-like oxidoreductase